MMKRSFLVLWASAAVACFAQSSPTESYIVVARREPVARYLVEYVTTEPCYECGSRYAINCGPSNPGCDVPSKNVQHFEEFNSKAEAIRFLNGGMTRDGECFTVDLTGRKSGIGTCTLTGSFPERVRKTFVRLMEVRDVLVDVKSTKIDIPQPPVAQETKSYAVR